MIERAAPAARWILVEEKFFLLCIERRLRGEARSVLDWLIANADYYNQTVIPGHQAICDATGISRPNISVAIRKLVEMEILQRLGVRVVVLNPELLWTGRLANRRDAVADWWQRRAERRVAAGESKKAVTIDLLHRIM
jgi:hypothetical protein